MASLVTALSAAPNLDQRQRNIRRTSNGVLWVAVADGTTFTKFYFSTDDGATWTEDATMRVQPSAGGAVPNQPMRPDIFIDQDDCLHLVYLDMNNAAITGTIKYRRGVPNAARTSYTLSAATQVGGEASTTSTFGYAPHVVAHRDPGSSPTTWSVHVVRGWYNGSTTSYAMYARLQLNSSGAVSTQSQSPYGGSTLTGWSNIGSQGTGADLTPSIAIRHTGDGRTVTTPDIYIVRPAPNNLNVHKLAWSSGTTWNDAGGFALASNINSQTHACTCDGTRFLVSAINLSNGMAEYDIPYTSSWVVGSFLAHTTTPALPASAAPGALTVVAHAATGDFYLVAQNSANADLYYMKWTRATTSYDAAWTLAYAGNVATPLTAVDVTYGLGVDVLFGESNNLLVQRAVAFNSNPFAPVLTAPAPASYQNLASGFTFSWTFSDPDSGQVQSSYALRRKVVGAPSYEYWNASTGAWQGTEIFNSTAAGSVTFASGKWANGNTYQWSVATKDNFSGGAATGPYASDITVVAQTPPSVVVNGPSGTITTSAPTVTWTDTLPGGATQTTYRVVVESGAYGIVPGSGTPFFDSGVVSSSANSLGVSGFINGVTYRVFVQVQETGGQTSGWSYSTFTLSLIPATAPGLVATGDAANARTSLLITNNDSHSVAANLQYSDDGGVTWNSVRNGSSVAIGPSPSSVTVYDYEATPGVARTYRVQVTYEATPNIITSAWVQAGPVTLTLTTWWVKDVTNPALNKSLCDAQQHVRNRKGDSVAVYPAGRTKPLVLRGPVHGVDGTFRTVVKTEAERTAALALFAAQDSILIQDPRGRQWYAEWIGDLSDSQFRDGQPHYAIQRNWVEVDVPG